MRHPFVLPHLLRAGCLLALSLALPALARAQAPVASGPPPPQVARPTAYCQVSARLKLNGRYVVSIDFGQQQKLLSENLLRDAAGKAVEFNSAMDALNWLSGQGWELASTFVRVDGGDSVAYYVLRRSPPG